MHQALVTPPLTRNAQYFIRIDGWSPNNFQTVADIYNQLLTAGGRSYNRNLSPVRLIACVEPVNTDRSIVQVFKVHTNLRIAFGELGVLL